MGLQTGFNGTQCDAPAGAGAGLPIPPENAEHNFAGDALAALPGFNFDPAKAMRTDRARTNRGDSSLEFPSLWTRIPAQAGALGALTVAAFLAALIDKLQAASSEPFLQTDPITFQDLQHGTLLIGPRGGAAGTIVLDNPEMTVIVGPPQAGFPVQQVVNSPADMVALLSFSEAVNAIYQLGQADPMTTGSTGPTTQHAETQFFMPDGPPLITLTTSTGLPPLPPDQPPDTGNNGPTGGFGNFPGEQPTPSRLAFEIDKDVLSHDEQVQTGGGVNIGTPGDPFVNTAGSVFGAGNIVVTLEANPSGAPSGLSVTGRGPIFLFKEIIAGNEVVVGRENSDDGAIAFVISVSQDGATLSVEQRLPIDHSDGGDILSIINDALLVRVTINDGTTSLSQTLPIGERVAFEDDEPVATDDPAEVQAQGVPVDVNALIILDTSGSMGSDSSPNSRISLAKAAILDFAQQPNVLSVSILTFDTTVDNPSIWFDVTTEAGLQALAAFLDPITGSGTTNYQDAISQAQAAWTPPPQNLPADLTNVYFISDGEPNDSLTSSQKQAWESFLASGNIGIDNAYAVGIGTNVNNGDLQDVAYPDDSDNVIIIDSADDLRETLESTTFTGAASGNVLDNDSFGSDGPGAIRTLSYDNNGALPGGETTYRLDGNDIYLNEVLTNIDPTEVTFETSAGGSFRFNFETGAWDYTSPETSGGEFTESFSYTIVDGDTDISASAMLNITVSPPGSSAIESLLASTQNPPVD